VHPVGFIIRIYHDARSPERSILCINLRTSMESLNFERGGISILIIYDVVAGSMEPYCSTAFAHLETQPGSSSR